MQPFASLRAGARMFAVSLSLGVASVGALVPAGAACAQGCSSDVNGDGRPDFIVGNKRGTAVLLSQKTVASK